MPDPRWTDETAELVANRIHRANCYDNWEGCRAEGKHRRAAGEALAALADAGLLLPPGGETREQWGVRHLNIESCQWAMHEHESREEAERSFEYFDEVWGHHTRLMRLAVHTGPWVEVPDA